MSRSVYLSVENVSTHFILTELHFTAWYILGNYVVVSLVVMIVTLIMGSYSSYIIVITVVTT